MQTSQDIPFAKIFASQSYLCAEEGIVYASENGCSAWYIDGSMEGERPDDWSNSRITNLLQQIESFNMQPVFHGNFKVPLASDVENLRQAAVDYTKKEIDLCQKLKAPLIIHGGVVVEPRLINQVKKKALNKLLLSLETLLNYANSCQVTILLENLSNYLNYKPFHYIFTHEEEYAFIIEKIPEINIFFDVGHANIADGKPDHIIRAYAKNIYGMSLSNNDGNHDQHLPLKQGRIDFHKIVKAIIDSKWMGLIAFETRGISPMKSIQDLKTIYDEVRNNAY